MVDRWLGGGALWRVCIHCGCDQLQVAARGSKPNFARRVRVLVRPGWVSLYAYYGYARTRVARSIIMHTVSPPPVCFCAVRTYKLLVRKVRTN